MVFRAACASSLCARCEDRWVSPRRAYRLDHDAMDKEHRRDRSRCFRWTFGGDLLRCGGHEHLCIERGGGYPTYGPILLDALAIDSWESRSRWFAFLDVPAMDCDCLFGYCIGVGVFSKAQLGALARAGIAARCVC